MAGLLYRLGRFSARRRWTVILSWLLIIALSGVGYSLFAGTISPSITIPGTPTAKVASELADTLPEVSGGSGSLVFSTTDSAPFTEEQKAGVASLLEQISGFAGVKSATDPFTIDSQLATERQQAVDGREQVLAGQQQLAESQAQLDQLREIDPSNAALAASQAELDASAATLTAQSTQLNLGQQLLDMSTNIRFVSEDQTAALATVQFVDDAFVVPPALKEKVVAATEDATIAGVEVTVSNELVQGVPNLIGPGEIAGIIFAAVVLLALLGTALGAALPLVSALVGIAVTLIGSLAFSGIVQFTSITPLLALMLGLAVGIDYSLFIINRHRTQLKAGTTVPESIGLANGTSGNAVVFAGTTVIVALVALNITGIPFLGLMGTVGAVAVAVAVLVAVTLTPAMLSVAGMRILRTKERRAIGSTEATAASTNAMSMRRAVLTLIAGIAVLGSVALPALGMRLGLPDGSSEATTSSQYATFTTIADKFGAGQNGALVIVADLPESASGVMLLQQQVAIATVIAEQDHVSAVAPIGVPSGGDVIAFQIIPTNGPSSVETEELVHDLRDISPLSTSEGAVSLGVAGNASAQIDISEKLGEVLPIYLAVVIGLSLIILLIVFRSILVPVIATAGFVLSLVATFGGLTAIYQLGWLSTIFGVHDPAPILSFLPVLEIGILFGLAMDYQLFLVSGMREAYAKGAPARIAVQRGLQVGRPVVTAAAIIMVSVFAGFVFSDSSTIRPIGFGLAFGVLIDAFVVRMLLVPAAMTLLGDAVWWMPKCLERVVPNIDVEGSSLERLHAKPDVEDWREPTRELTTSRP
ncbi:MMPL family transporter [uncultured Microbacterium sp.]|uniref:MMPL family transporter n=1 Tax=uncultured Microbacterium sp. TaxID=191216 RepID=UPI0035CBCFDA